MRCYNCGAELGKEDNCQNCGTNVKVYKKILMASNAYYNDALEKAGVRDLSGAIESLKISLRFNKLNIDARNLLGLIYYEMGEVVAALTEWVISKNYQPKDNLASRYLDEVQKNQARLDSVNQTIKKYNQALLYCKQNSRDLAIIQLKKVLSLNPKLVSGHQLLALLYIQEGRYDLAKKSLRNAGKIDANNTVTLRYLKEANAALREQNPSKKQKNDELIGLQWITALSCTQDHSLEEFIPVHDHGKKCNGCHHRFCQRYVYGYQIPPRSAAINKTCFFQLWWKIFKKVHCKDYIKHL